MTIRATNIVAPVFTAAEVVVLFAPGMARQAGFGDLLGRLVLEGDDFLRVAFLGVGLAWTMTRLATRHLLLPTAKPRELSMRSMRESLELIFMAVFTSFTADVLILGLDHRSGGSLFRGSCTPGVQESNAR